MILVDTCVWADHFRQQNEVLTDLLNREKVVCHPFVIGEILMGSPRNRVAIREELSDLPQADVADHHEVLRLVEQKQIYGTGMGYVDAHLLTSVCLTPGTLLWTTDRRMASVAERWGLIASLPNHLH